MLIEVTYFVQPPQGVSLEGCPSVERLKRFNLTDGPRRNARQLLVKPFETLNSEPFDNRELRAFWDATQSSQTPNELVKRRTHVVEGITGNQTDVVRNIHELNAENVSLIFKIILTRNRTGTGRSAELPDLNVESLKVMLRPTQFQIGITQTIYMRMLAVLVSEVLYCPN
jgi:hypothetical protein